MAELTVNQLIKIIIGIFVFVAIVVGFYFFFKERVIDFFQNIPTGEGPKFVFSLFEKVSEIV